jgi:hypothetical protein
MKLFASLSGEQQGAGETSVVVPGEKLLRPEDGADERSCAIRRASQQKRAAASMVPNPRIGEYRYLIPR